MRLPLHLALGENFCPVYRTGGSDALASFSPLRHRPRILGSLRLVVVGMSLWMAMVFPMTCMVCIVAVVKLGAPLVVAQFLVVICF